MFYRVMAVVIIIGTIVTGVSAGAVPASLYLMIQVSAWGTIHFGETLVYSVLLERMFRRDRLLAEYVPAGEGNWWLVAGCVALLCWSAMGYSMVMDKGVWGVVGWVAPVFVVVFVLSYGRARSRRKVFRAEVEAARDASFDKRFFDIVDNEKEW
jgi:hypothetical protein